MKQILKLNETKFVRDSIAWVEWFGTEFGTIKNGFKNPSIKTEWEKLAWKRSKGIILSIQRNDILQHFWRDSSFMYCHNIEGLLQEVGIPDYNSTVWRLFIDSSKRSLKCVVRKDLTIFLHFAVHNFTVKHIMLYLLEHSILLFSPSDWLYCQLAVLWRRCLYCLTFSVPYNAMKWFWKFWLAGFAGSSASLTKVARLWLELGGNHHSGNHHSVGGNHHQPD